MINWLVETLRAYPELGDLPCARAGLLGRPEEDRGLQSRQRHRHAAGGCGDRPARHRRAGSDQVRFLPAVPVRGRLWRRTAVLPWTWQGRPEADPLLADRAGVLPAGAVRMRADRRARHGLRGRPLRGLADDFCVDRRRNRPDGPARTRARRAAGLPRRDSGRLCGQLHLRHDRFCHRARAARSEADRRGPAGRLRGIREAARRHDRRQRPGCSLRLSQGRAARLPRRCRERADRQAGARNPPRPQGLRRARAPRRPHHRGRCRYGARAR